MEENFAEEGSLLRKTIDQVEPLDEKSMEEAWKRWDSRCKPLRGFGRLEELVVQLAGIFRNSRPCLDRRAIVIMGADNGVVAEGVSQTGSEVTAQVLENMGQHKSSVCVMSRMIRADVIPVNIGMNCDAQNPQIRNLPVRYGTGNIAEGPAMTAGECVRAVETGILVVRELAKKGYHLVAAGEMGIGNTTTSAACICVLTGRDPAGITGRGAGLSSAALARKTEVIRRALSVNRPDPSDALDVMAKVGGLDIAGMAGCFLGGAACRIPVLIDGAISAAAACFAVMLCPGCADYLIATHASSEPASVAAMELLQKKPLLYADMHLGEGTGAAAVLPLLDQALNVYENLPAFEESGVAQYRHLK